MKHAIIIALAVTLAVVTPAVAQDDGEGTRLERLLEGVLSGAGREVTVRGFRGALSGRAQLESLTISDDEGVWLSLSDAVLDWNRSALLRGRLDVTELSAARIEMPRRPVEREPDPLSPEASGTALALPELPVAIAVDSVSADAVVLGPGVLGQAASFTLDGAFRLDEGAGDARLLLERTDGPRGEIALEAAFSNATNELALSLSFDEGANGVAAGLLGLPGAPVLSLSVTGEGTLDDFAANLTLATEGSERLGGTLRAIAEDGTRRFEASLQGDLRPLVEPQYRPFFGERAALEATALRQPDGTTELSGLDVETDALTLRGTARIAADGVPLLFDVAGTVGTAGEEPLLLPIGGPETRIERAEIDLGYDAALGDRWQGRVVVTGLEREGFSAAEITLEGDGTISAEPAAVTVGLDLAADALDFGRAEAQEALGEAVSGRVDLAWVAGEPIEVETLRIVGESYGAEAQGRISNFSSTLDVAGTLRARADALEAFSGLAGRPLRGRLEASLEGSGGAFTGLADLRASIAGTDLLVGVERLDPYLDGETAFDLEIRRTTSGIFVDSLNLTGPQAEVVASGQLSTGAGRLSASAQLGDIGPIADGLAGRGEVRLDASMTENVWTWSLAADAMETEIFGEGTLADPLGAPILTAAGDVDVGDFGAFADLAGRSLGGSADLRFAARAEPGSSRYALSADGTLRDAEFGVPEVEPLLAGVTDIAFSGTLDNDAISINRLNVSSEHVVLDASGATTQDFRSLSADARLALTDIGDIVDGLSGPATMALNVTPQTPNGPWGFELDATAPGATAEASGELRDLAGVPSVEGALQLSVSDLSPIASLVDRPLSGAIDLTAEGSVQADLSQFDIDLSSTATGARTGIVPLDRILQGVATLDLAATRDAGTISVETFDLSTPLLTAAASGSVGEATAFGFTAELADISPFVDGFSGAVSAEGRAEAAGDGLAAVDVVLRGPAGSQATVDGTIAQTGQNANLAISGAAPLGLINGLIAPRAVAGDARFDLRLDGPLALESVSGRATTQGALLTAPELDLALENIAATVDLGSGRANVQLDSAFRGGGRVRVEGPIGFGAGLPADLDIALDGVRLTDPALYQTSLDARLALSGPLQGAARISGEVDVGETEIRIPSTGGGARAGIPEITHVGEPAAVRATRERAGLTGNGDGDGRASGAAILLDVLVNAPNRIFVRGRGLDAELGGRLRLRGTTADVAPAGRFDLIRGRLDILGRRLDMTSGSVTLTGALDPRVNLVAETSAEDVDISIIVEGVASNPEIRFESRPELPQDEILALLLFGRGVDSLSPLQIARLAGAIATLGSSGGGLLGGLREGVGLADLDVTSSEGGGTAVRAGAYISDNIYTDVTVNSQGEAEVNLNLDLSRSLTVRGRTSNTGESGIGLFFERDY